MFSLKRFWVLATTCLLLTGAAFAQVNRGSITGIVTDQTGAVVPDVAITITNVGTGVANNVTSNSDGVYNVPLLDPAIYKLTAEKEGFKKYSQTGITVNVGQVIRVDFALSLGSKTDTVTVTASPLTVERESSDLGTTITNREVQELPLTSFGDQRSAMDFMQLAPGVTGEGSNSGGAFGGTTSDRTFSTQVSGSMVSSTSLMVDGADVTSEGGFEGMTDTIKIPPDAIAEFKMEATNGSAEYGRSGGGTASFQIKSGSNAIHGTGYEFLRNTALDARNFFSPSTPIYHHNEFGANAGGAIIKNKAFVFGYYNGFRLVEAASSNTSTIPTAQMDQGNFTNYGYCTDAEINSCAANPGAWVQTQLLDPTNGTPTGPLVTGNMISPTNFDPVSSQVLKVISSKSVVPNVGNSPRDIFNNFTSPAPNQLRVDEWGVKGDYVFNDKSRIALTYLTGKAQTPNVPSIPAPLGGGDQPSINQTRNVRLNWSYSLRPTVINQATLSLNQYKSGTQPVSSYAGNSNWVGYLGIKGVTPNYPTEWPQIVINQQSWNGGGGAGFSNDHSSGINDTVSWIKGKHSIKFGMQYLRGADNSVSTGNSGGYFNFLNQETGLQSAPNTTGIADASFELGLADEGRTYVFTTPAYSRTTYAAAFAQDDYKFTKKLTFNLGVRWDLFMPVTHKYYDKDWVNPSIDNTALSAPGIPGEFQLASSSNASGMNTYYKNFSPRIGLAYSLNDKTVVRAAYGIFYAQGNGDRVDGGSTVMGFNQTLSSGTGILQENGITAPGFTWGTQSLPAFTPPVASSFGPLGQLGKGVARHSAGTLISVDPTDSMAPYMQNYTLSVQRQLPSSMVLTVAFVGNEGVHEASRLTSWDKLPPQYLHLQNQLNNSITTAASQLIPEIARLPIDPNTGNHSPFQGFEALYGGGGLLPAGSPPGTAGNTTPLVGQALIENRQYDRSAPVLRGLGRVELRRVTGQVGQAVLEWPDLAGIVCVVERADGRWIHLLHLLQRVLTPRLRTTGTIRKATPTRIFRATSPSPTFTNCRLVRERST